MKFPLRVVAGLLVLAFSSVAFAGEINLEKTDSKVIVKVGDELFTKYHTDVGPKPILWPIIGPTGEEMTRAYPMKEVEGERKDHPHHRSFWFTHGNVNGVDFWSETRNHGSIKHREFKQVSGNTIVTVNDWLGPDGKKILEDERRLTFHAQEDARMIDFAITLKATAGPVTFGDTKEGSFGVRVPTVLDVDRKLGGKITNAEGLNDKQAWGKPSPWVDYTGKLAGKNVGIAILNHPESFRYPTHWHVRTYGLFAANPFGYHDFKSKVADDGTYELPEGESFTLRYRVIFHEGNTEEFNVKQAFDAYAKTK